MLRRPRVTLRRFAFSLKRYRLPALALLFGLLVGLASAEVVVRVTNVDWRLINRMVYYQAADRPNQRPDPDPRVLYRLVPGIYDYDDYVVQVNSLGARGPERRAEKPPGVFRVVCLGGSNVYGLGLSNEQTWPAQLEQELNLRGDRRYEVWNYGMPAHVALQMAAIGREALARLQPDLFIFALSNSGPRPFQYGHPIRGYFARDPGLWRGLFADDCLPGGAVAPYAVRLTAIRHLRSLRYLAAYRNTGVVGCDWISNQEHDHWNTEAAREFFVESQRQRVGVCAFLYPGHEIRPADYHRYFIDTNVPVFFLDAADKAPEFRDIHPPAYVMEWYAYEIARWLDQHPELLKTHVE
jgi:hypothetical protein